MRHPQSLAPDQKPPMPTTVTGKVLNLNRATDRWKCMASQIKRLGWEGTHGRYSARSATIKEAQAVGLPSAGYLGVWRSTNTLLEEWLNGQPGPKEVLHLIEDDAILHQAMPLILKPWQDGNSNIDMLFTESFLTVSLYRRFQALEEKRKAAGGGILFLNGGQYLACASSVFLTVTGAQRLLSAMQQAESTGRVPVNDQFFRELIHRGKLTAAIILPFFSTIAPLEDSAFQTDLDLRITLSKKVDLALRRLLYLQAWEPDRCGNVLNEMGDVLGRGLTAKELEVLVLRIFAVGRDSGWLRAY